MPLYLLMRSALLIAALTAISTAQGFQEVNGQLFTSGLSIINSPQPDTPLGGDTLHVSIDVSGNGRLTLPPYPDDFKNGIGSLHLFLISTVTGLNLTISNGTFNGWSRDTLDTPEFLCNSTTNENFQNAGCQQIMLQESSSTVKHVNWVWPNCLVGNGGADNGKCISGAPLEDCLDGTARGPYNISFHEAFRLDGEDFYTIVDLPIRVTNSIPEDTELAGSQVRPRCDLRNNPLIPFDDRNRAIKAPASQPYLGDSFDGSNEGDGGSSNNGHGGNGNDGSNNGGNGVLDPGAPGSGSLGSDPFSGGAISLNSRSFPFVAALVSCILQLLQ